MSTNKIEQKHLDEKGIRYACTDVGNNARFVSQHGDELVYLEEERRWVGWDGTRWKPTDTKIYKRAEDTVRRIYDEARDCKNSQGQTELTNWARKSQFKHRIDSMVSMAANSLEVSITEFDDNPTVINCKNGIVDLSAGALIAHEPSQRVMRRAEAKYDPKASCPKWEQFLDQIFLGDKELISFFQTALGYTVTGLTNHHALFIAYGLGANGKTTAFETVLRILGDYAQATEFSTFLNTDKTDARNREAVGMLKGIRFAVASETDSSRKWNESLVKKLTGGDTLTGARLYGSSYQFQPTHKLWFQANHLPGAKDATHGFWRRPIVIPFKAQFTGAKIDAGLKDNLLKERDGIFRWLVDGAQRYLKHGLGKLPQACEEANQQYEADNDVLGRFVSERMTADSHSSVAVADVFAAYERWCVQNSEEVPHYKFFLRNMEERAVSKKRNSRGMVFVGYRLGGSPQPDPAETYSMDQPREAVGEWKPLDWGTFSNMTDDETERLMETIGAG